MTFRTEGHTATRGLKTALDYFTDSFIEALLWSETDPDSGAGDDNYTDNGELSDEARRRIEKDCQLFWLEHRELIKGNASQAGHDFCLTRNGHGCGFWDGDWPEPAATTLTEACESFGELSIYRGDDGQLCIA